jgi:hypothetical protein
MRSSATIFLRQVLWATALWGCVAGVAYAQLPAARVMSVTGTAKAIDTLGTERTLEKGGEVRSGEKIVTSEGALVQMRLNDGGFLSVRPGTEMVIDRFVYDDKNASNSNFLVSLVRGGFRSITGLIGRTNPNAYQIRTGTATIGIRGTDHEPMVIPEGVQGMALQGAPGFYDKVNEGETFIRNRNGMLTLKRGDIGFSPVIADRAPLVLQKIPDFYKIEIKTDARDPKDAADAKGDGNKRLADGPALLRPSVAARAAALRTGDVTIDTAATLVSPTALRASNLGTVDLGGATVVVPDKTVLPSTSTLLSPSTSALVPTTSSLVVPSSTVTPASPVLSGATLQATTTFTPVTTTVIAPATTLIAPAPAITTIAPATTVIAPITTISPTTTLTAPKILNNTILLK